MPKPEFEFFTPTDTIPDHGVGGVKGLTERILSEDPETGDYSRMLHFAPGTDTSAMGVQRHDFWEEVFIVEGSFVDLYSPGMLLAILWIALMNSADSFFTIVHLQSGGQEVNPIAGALLGTGRAEFVL